MYTILGFLIALLPIVGTLFFARKLIRAVKAPANNYAFGRKDIEVLSLFIQNKKFEQAETMMSQMNSDDLTQSIDHIALTSSEKHLKKFHEMSNQNALSCLLLGAWYLHSAWRVRAGKVASDLKEKEITTYIEYLKSSAPLLEAATKEYWLATEAHSRLIRVYMGLGYGDTARAHFNEAIKANPNHLWAYIHESELIQSKWQGSIEEVKAFNHSLPNNEQIRLIVKLKLIYDGILTEENYFDFEGDVVESTINELLIAFDSDLELKPLNSIHVYIAYGYIYLLSSFANNKQLEKKYKKLINGNYTLYPFGII